MTQKRREADSGKAIGEMTALRWEPTYVTKPNPRVVPLQPPPESKTDVQAFLGFVNFYRRFIWDFSAKARSLFDLTRSEQVWTWSGKKQTAFEDLKTAVTTAPVLASPQDSEPFRVEADSSDFATGAVLSQ